MKLVAKMRPGKNVIPAGVFYYNISDPIVSATTESAEEIEDKIKGELRLKGMVNSDKDIAEKMDNTEGTSLNIPVSRKADGGFDSRRSKVMNTEQFNILGRFVDVRAIDTADRIAVVISGEVLIKMDSFQAVTDVLMGQCVDFQWICQAAIIEN